MNAFLDGSVVLDVLSPPQKRLDAPSDGRVGMWHAPAVIAENNFVYKSLSNWAFNVGGLMLSRVPLLLRSERGNHQARTETQRIWRQRPGRRVGRIRFAPALG